MPDVTNPCREARAVLGITQEKLAERVGVSRSSIALWEKEEEKIPRWAIKFLDFLLKVEALLDDLKSNRK